jgi:phytoene desaturase
MHSANEKFFNDKKTIQLFDRYATYNGSNPYKVPATLNIIQHVEYNLGSYIPRKGMYSVANALHRLAEKNGVRFHFNDKVKRIVHQEKKVKGIINEVNGSEVFHENEIVVSNADVNFTYQNLLNVSGNKSAKKYASLEPSSSAMVFYWGVKGIYNELETHNILFSDDYQKEFTELFEVKISPADPTVYIYISSKFNSSDAPHGCENWFVMINAPANYGQDWKSEINRIRNTVLKKIKDILKIDLYDKIIFERILTPVDIENNTSSFRGSIYGISSNNKSAAFLRQRNRSKDFKGLYFCGGSAHPGGGIPLVLLSGKITSDLIKRYEAL